MNDQKITVDDLKAALDLVMAIKFENKRAIEILTRIAEECQLKEEEIKNGKN